MGSGKGQNKRIKSSLHANTRVANKTYLTRQVVRKTVTNLAQEIFQNTPKSKNDNFILNALTTEKERQTASSVHSTGIKTGYFFEELFNHLATVNPNLNVMPREQNRGKKVTQFNSRLKYQMVSKAADQITRNFYKLPPERRTPENLTSLVNKQREILNSSPSNFSEEEHTYYSDSGFVDKLNNETYLIEAKSSANLDSKSAPNELRNLLKACLALDPEKHPIVHPIAICLYDDPGNSLKRAFPNDHVYTGMDWVKLIDNNVDFDDFKDTVSDTLLKLKQEGKLFLSN